MYEWPTSMWAKTMPEHAVETVEVQNLGLPFLKLRVSVLVRIDVLLVDERAGACADLFLLLRRGLGFEGRGGGARTRTLPLRLVVVRVRDNRIIAMITARLRSTDVAPDLAHHRLRIWM